MNPLVRFPAEAAWAIRKRPAYAITVLIGALLFSVALISNFGGDYYSGKWVGFSLCAAYLLALRIGSRFGILLSTLSFYLIANTVWLTMYAKNRYSTISPYDTLALREFSYESGFKLFAIGAAVLLIRDFRKTRGYAGLLSTCFVIASCAEIAWQAMRSGCHVENSCGGELGNPSMNASMMAAAMPLVFSTAIFPYNYVLLALAAVGAVLGKSNVGLGMVVLFIGMRAWHLRKHAQMLLLLTIPAIFLLAKKIFYTGKLFNSGDRFEMWRFFMGRWLTAVKAWIFGAGFGTFGVFSINIQKDSHMRSDPITGVTGWWVWLHNDWLQGIFETGAVGGLLMVLVYWSAAIGLWRKRFFPELEALILFGVFMGSNYPLHVGLPSMFGAWLVALGLVKSLKPCNFNT